MADMRLKLLAALAVAVPLCNCASGSFSLTPDDVHVAVGVGTSLYSLGCAFASDMKACSEANQKKAAAVGSAVNGAIDILPQQQP